MSKFKILFISSAVISFLLSGCASVPPPTTTTVKCDTKGECTVTVTWKKSSGTYDGLASLINDEFGLDFNNSNRPLLNHVLNSSSITLKSNNNPIAIKSVDYEQNNQKLAPINQADIANWLANYNGQVNEIEISVSGLNFGYQGGSNSVTTEIVTNNSVLAGASTSWYRQPTPGTGYEQQQ